MRIEGRIKMGFYPTPEVVIEHIKALLCFPSKTATIIDPCCGEGEAIRQLTEGINAKTYGIELDKARANRASMHLHHVLQADYEHTRITRSVFSLLWLNPPYDDGEECRLEFSFLKNTADCLQPGGILVYIIPQKRLTKRIARYLASRFERIGIWQFPEKEYKAFGQIVVTGIRRKTTTNGDIPPKLENIPEKKLPALGENTKARYDVPVGKRISIFKSTELDSKELEAEIAKSPLWERLSKQTKGVTESQPPLPLHKGHLGLLLASGKLDGVQGEGEDKHLVRGKVTKHQSVSEIVNDDGSQETRVLESFKVAIKLLTADGQIRVLA